MYRKKYRKTRAIFYNWKTADRIELVFVNNRSKGTKNIPGWHHARSYDRFPDIRLQITTVRLIATNCFLAFLQCFSCTLVKRFRFFKYRKKMILNYWLVHNKSTVYKFEFLGLFSVKQNSKLLTEVMKTWKFV